jgi:hypothetical protein
MPSKSRFFGRNALVDESFEIRSCSEQISTGEQITLSEWGSLRNSQDLARPPKWCWRLLPSVGPFRKAYTINRASNSDTQVTWRFVTCGLDGPVDLECAEPDWEVIRGRRRVNAIAP